MLIRWKSKDKSTPSTSTGNAKKKRKGRDGEEDWQNDKGRNQQNEQAEEKRRGMRSREDPRRHTLGGDMMHYQNQGEHTVLQRSFDLETPSMRTYTPINQGPLFDDDPGIMSEVETSSTGFRRGGKQRSSLPVVRTPSKTLERPLGLVFLQYRSETKRALLPNEITSIDTVRALFVRSFPRQLTMQYLEGPNVKIYIHDSSKDMFYELEDVRSHLREIRDRSVLRLFESNEVASPQVLPGGTGVPQPLPPTCGQGVWDSEQSYFSEPEFDSEYRHQHIHKSKAGKTPYFIGAQTLPRGIYSDRNKNTAGLPAKPLRSYGSKSSIGPSFPYTSDQLYSIPDGYMSSPERGASRAYEEPYYSQYSTRGNTATPIIDEEQGDVTLAEDQYAMYGVKGLGRIPPAANQIYDPARPEDIHRIRVEHMERQLANLTGLVQKALTQKPQTPLNNSAQNVLSIPAQYRSDKSVSFEKSVSFSDDIQGTPKSYTPNHLGDSKPSKPAIKSSTLPRTSSQERDRLKPAPPPKPLVLASNQYNADLSLAPEVYNNLRGLQKKAKDLRIEVRAMRRLTQTQVVTIREDIKGTFMRIRATLLASSGTLWGQTEHERTNMAREEEIYKQEVMRLEKDLSDLESSVEGLRGEVINRRTRVNMTAVEDMALVLSRASKTVAELKIRFPSLQQDLRNFLSLDMERLCREETFLKEEPERLESALRRCKKLTGTLVTLKRLASVQEQRLPIPESTLLEEPLRTTEGTPNTSKPVPSPRQGPININGGVAPENALDALLDELQTFAKPPNGVNEIRPDDSTSDDSSQAIQSTVTTKISQSQLYPESMSTNVGLRRLHSYPSGSDTDTSPPQPMRPTGKPPVPERNADLLSKVNSKRVPPPPPPRTSSRSPLASPTSPNMPHQMQQLSEIEHQTTINFDNLVKDSGMDSSSESVSSDNSQRQQALELRHQELLKKQKQLQEQYQRLQQISKNSIPLVSSTVNEEKKNTHTNFVQKNRTNMANNIADKTCSNATDMTSTANGYINMGKNDDLNVETSSSNSLSKTINKVYETDIL
ncbi:coiled-coil domain-containing protein AGAP005037 isoform X2 [Toxorhynchites rutilus septentrionalis]|uniref:coiled-coil domain-containing protein AGAP005037 isoform X2 n=1 Tax=Toxorhynchites rutilus septentrionalis TaxID=329112 RepID=UPI00247A207A|nr:coiled-coil domain-containing protein AGAP005037 isoform X2 [Toxorhynchites rutilus septentrionalis]